MPPARVSRTGDEVEASAHLAPERLREQSEEAGEAGERGYRESPCPGVSAHACSALRDAFEDSSTTSPVTANIVASPMSTA